MIHFVTLDLAKKCRQLNNDWMDARIATRTVLRTRRRTAHTLQTVYTRKSRVVVVKHLTSLLQLTLSIDAPTRSSKSSSRRLGSRRKSARTTTSLTKGEGASGGGGRATRRKMGRRALFPVCRVRYNTQPIHTLFRIRFFLNRCV